MMGGLGGKTAGKDLSAHAIRCAGSLSAELRPAGAHQRRRLDLHRRHGDAVPARRRQPHPHRQLPPRPHHRWTHARLPVDPRARDRGPNRIRTELEIGTDNRLSGALRRRLQQRDGKENKLLEIGKLLTVADRNPGKVSPEIIARAEEAAAALSAEIEGLRGEEDAGANACC